MLAHGPRIEPGFQTGVTKAAVFSTADSGRSVTGINMGAHVAYGFRDKMGEGAFRVAAQLGLYGQAVDIYAQLGGAGAGASHTGVGVQLIRGLGSGVMPYGMVGWTLRSGGLVYFGQGIYDGPTGVGASSRFIGVTVLGLQRGEGQGNLFVMVFVGRQDRDDFSYAPRVQIGTTGSFSFFSRRR